MKKRYEVQRNKSVLKPQKEDSNLTVKIDKYHVHRKPAHLALTEHAQTLHLAGNNLPIQNRLTLFHSSSQPPRYFLRIKKSFDSFGYKLHRVTKTILLLVAAVKRGNAFQSSDNALKLRQILFGKEKKAALGNVDIEEGYEPAIYGQPLPVLYRFLFSEYAVWGDEWGSDNLLYFLYPGLAVVAVVVISISVDLDWYASDLICIEHVAAKKIRFRLPLHFIK